MGFKQQAETVSFGVLATLVVPVITTSLMFSVFVIE